MGGVDPGKGGHTSKLLFYRDESYGTNSVLDSSAIESSVGVGGRHRIVFQV